jgi:uncharacterized membrane protein
VGAEINRRQELVDQVYLAESPAGVLGLLDRLGARYVVVGRIERDYPVDLNSRFDGYLDMVFESGSTRVYMVPRFSTLETS